MCAFNHEQVDKAFFISPIVDMEKLIFDMMGWADITEEKLREKQLITTGFGETLSWEYLCYVRNHPVNWSVPTYILYGDKDNLTSQETIHKFANDANAEYVARLRNIMDTADVSFQTAELGKVDEGGGGTIAYILANYDMNVIDSGVPVLNMHAPWEIISKVDLYEAFRGYIAFLKEA